MKSTEVSRSGLKVGDTLVSKADPRRTFRVEEVSTGMNGYGWPFLVMRDRDGNRVEHDTSLDSVGATYTVQNPDDGSLFGSTTRADWDRMAREHKAETDAIAATHNNEPEPLGPDDPGDDGIQWAQGEGSPR